MTELIRLCLQAQYDRGREAGKAEALAELREGERDALRSELLIQQQQEIERLADALAASQEALRRAYALLLAGDAREAEAVLYRRLSALDST